MQDFLYEIDSVFGLVSSIMWHSLEISFMSVVAKLLFDAWKESKG